MCPFCILHYVCGFAKFLNLHPFTLIPIRSSRVYAGDVALGLSALRTLMQYLQSFSTAACRGVCHLDEQLAAPAKASEMLDPCLDLAASFLSWSAASRERDWLKSHTCIAIHPIDICQTLRIAPACCYLPADQTRESSRTWNVAAF